LRRAKNLSSARRRMRHLMDRQMNGTPATTQTFTTTLSIGSSEMIKADGFDDCIIGFAEVWDGNERVYRIVYNASDMYQKLMAEGMSSEEAQEYFEFNIDSAYVGKETPIYMWPGDNELVEEFAESLDD